MTSMSDDLSGWDIEADYQLLRRLHQDALHGVYQGYMTRGQDLGAKDFMASVPRFKGAMTMLDGRQIGLVKALCPVIYGLTSNLQAVRDELVRQDYLTLRQIVEDVELFYDVRRELLATFNAQESKTALLDGIERTERAIQRSKDQEERAQRERLALTCPFCGKALASDSGYANHVNHCERKFDELVGNPFEDLPEAHMTELRSGLSYGGPKLWVPTLRSYNHSLVDGVDVWTYQASKPTERRHLQLTGGSQ